MTAPVFVAVPAPPSWAVQLLDALGESVSTVGQSVASLTYIRVAVRATVNGITPYNPTADVVQFGFQNELNNTSGVAPTTWYAGAWETDTISGITTYVAKLLVGPLGRSPLPLARITGCG